MVNRGEQRVRARSHGARSVGSDAPRRVVTVGSKGTKRITGAEQGDGCANGQPKIKTLTWRGAEQRDGDARQKILC